MPRAAEEYREQIGMGLDGNPREAQKARHTLRKMIPENVRLTPNGNELWAEYALKPAAVLVSCASREIGNTVFRTHG